MESKLIFHFLVLATFCLLPLSLQAQLSQAADCQGITLEADITRACHSGQNGNISLRISQGLPPYQVHWGDGGKQLARNVAAGNYQVTVTDALGCSVNGNFEVNRYPIFQASAIVKNTTRPGKSNGSIEIVVNGGTPPYHYSWTTNNGYDFPEFATEKHQINKLPAGIYKIVVFDGAGCYSELETEVK